MLIAYATILLLEFIFLIPFYLDFKYMGLDFFFLFYLHFYRDFNGNGVLADFHDFDFFRNLIAGGHGH